MEKVNIGDYIKITTNDEEKYAGMVYTVGATFADKRFQSIYQIMTHDKPVTILESQIQEMEKITQIDYLAEQIDRIVKERDFKVEETAAIGKKSFALMKNWEILSDFEKGVLTEFFIQARCVDKILDQNAMYRKFCLSMQEHLGLSGLEF